MTELSSKSDETTNVEGVGMTNVEGDESIDVEGGEMGNVEERRFSAALTRASTAWALAPEVLMLRLAARFAQRAINRCALFQA